jgi:hypothetical protein
MVSTVRPSPVEAAEMDGRCSASIENSERISAARAVYNSRD